MTRVDVILISESPDDAQRIERVLRDAGHVPTVQRAGSRGEYLAALADGVPDVVIADGDHPGFAATVALALHKQRAPDVPFVVLLAAGGSDLRAAALLAQGAADYLERDRLGRLPVAVARAREHERARQEQAATERQLRDSERRFRALVEHGAEALALLAADGTIRWVGPNTARVLGFRPEEMLGRTVYEFVHSQEIPALNGHLEELLARQGGSASVQLRHRLKRGGYRWVDATCTNLLGDPAVAAIVVNYRDVSERRQAEQALRDSEALLRQVTDHIPGFIWLRSLEDRRLLYVSAGYERIWGRSRQSLLLDPEGWLAAVHPDDRERVSALSMEPGELPATIEFRIVRRDGAVRRVRNRVFPILDEAGKLYRIGGVIDDVGEERVVGQEEPTLRLEPVASTSASAPCA